MGMKITCCMHQSVWSLQTLLVQANMCRVNVKNDFFQGSPRSSEVRHPSCFSRTALVLRDIDISKSLKEPTMSQHNGSGLPLPVSWLALRWDNKICYQDRFGNHQPWHTAWKNCAGRYFRLSSRITPTCFCISKIISHMLLHRCFDSTAFEQHTLSRG